MARLRVLGENPPPPRGTGENQLRELRDYLTRLKDELEFLLTHLGEDNFAESLATWVTDTGKSVESINASIDDINGEIGDINTALAGKQNTLTFDDTPTSGSDNPVKSGGVYSALSGKQDTLTFDNSPTNGSSNPVKSGGVYSALAGKQNTLTFDNSPTSGSDNPVKSSGIYDALQRKVNSNLLTNAYFIGGGTFTNLPINQRGQTSYTVAGYCIDRWNSQRTTHTLTLQSGCIHWERVNNGSYNPLFYQPVKVVQGEVYTYSILYRSTFRKLRETFTAALLPEASDWTLYSQTATVSGASANIGVQDISYNQGLDDTGKYIEIKAMKLELGSEQTLAHLENGAWVLNEIPDYWDELYKCQRYLKKINGSANVYPAWTDASNLYFFVAGGALARAPDAISSQQITFFAGSDSYTITGNMSAYSYYDGILCFMSKGSIPSNVGGSLILTSTIFVSAE